MGKKLCVKSRQDESKVNIQTNYEKNYSNYSTLKMVIYKYLQKLCNCSLFCVVYLNQALTT